MGAKWREDTKERKRKLVHQIRELAARKGLATPTSIAGATGYRRAAIERWLNGTVLPYDKVLQNAIEKLRALPAINPTPRRVTEVEPIALKPSAAPADALAGSFHAEVAAMGRIAETLEHLPRETRLRVINWASERYAYKS